MEKMNFTFDSRPSPKLTELKGKLFGESGLYGNDRRIFFSYYRVC